MASSSGSCRFHVFLSFSPEDARRPFLNHLLMALERRWINSFNYNDTLFFQPAIKEAGISVVIFSKNYAASTGCLDELAEIHNCYKRIQKVIPIFYNVDPSEVKIPTGEVGESFMKTCEGQPDGKKQRWIEALKEVADLDGGHVYNRSDEGSFVEMIADDVSSRLNPLWVDPIKLSRLQDFLEALPPSW